LVPASLSRPIYNIIPVDVQTLAHQHISKVTTVGKLVMAWCALTNLSINNNTYLRPGITPAVDDINTNCSFSRRGRSTAKVTSNTDGSFYAHNHQEDSQKRIRGTATSFDCSSSSSPGDGKLTSGKVPWLQAARPSFVPHGWKLEDRALAVLILKQTR
ncbi:hypothetical protein IGI04_034472, partial [Brassica rapa subsp. trilocularis]